MALEVGMGDQFAGHHRHATEVGDLFGFDQAQRLLGVPAAHQNELAAGGKLVLMRRWDAKEALRLIEAEKVTNLSGVPVMARELITHPDFESHDLSSLMSLGGGGH